MKNVIIITLIVAMTCLLSCEQDQTITNIVNEQSIDDPEAIVRSNAIILQDAVDAFVEEGIAGWGTVPKDAYADTTVNGKNLIDFLPGGVPLLNPYTGERDQPVDTTASSPGEIGYQTNPSNLYYIISGFGDSTLVVEFSNLQELEEQVVLNCYRLMDAAEAFARENGGYYAADNATVNDSCKTIVDYLPGGMLMINPLTGARSEPAVFGGAAGAAAGQTGYAPLNYSGYYVGYYITGSDHCGMVMITLYRGPEVD